MATVIPFPAVRLDDPADALFVALMQSSGETVTFGEVVELARRSTATGQDNGALEQTQSA